MRRLVFGLASMVLMACGHHDNSYDALVKVEAEPAGANCTYGGTAIHTGVDGNRNSILDENEITSSDYICETEFKVACPDDASTMEGPVSLRDAADFAALAGVTCVDGDLVILGSSLITLPELPELATVTGSVIVAANLDLESLSGLSAIHDVGKKYVVQGNPVLYDLSTLSGLQHFEYITIVGNDGLTDLAGLSGLGAIEGGLEIVNNKNLTSLHGLEGLTRNAREAIVIQSNRNLASLDALASLRGTPALIVKSNPNLVSATLPSLESIDSYMLVEDNAALASLQLPALVTTNGLYVRSNPVLAGFAAPELLLTAAFQLQNSLALSAITLPKLTYTTTAFDLNGLPMLGTLDAPSLTAVGGTFSLVGLAQLSSVSGFGALSTVGGDLVIWNTNVPTQTAQAFAQTIAVSGTVSIN